MRHARALACARGALLTAESLPRQADVDEILATHGKDGKIGYDAFKRWSVVSETAAPTLGRVLKTKQLGKRWKKKVSESAAAAAVETGSTVYSPPARLPPPPPPSDKPMERSGAYNPMPSQLRRPTPTKRAPSLRTFDDN